MVPATFLILHLIGAVAIILLSIKKIRLSANGLYYASVCAIAGFLLNRVNVVVTGMEASSGTAYFPSWMEISITIAIVATGFFAFALAVRYLPIFTHSDEASGKGKGGSEKEYLEPTIRETG